MLDPYGGRTHLSIIGDLWQKLHPNISERLSVSDQVLGKVWKMIPVKNQLLGPIWDQNLIIFYILNQPTFQQLRGGRKGSPPWCWSWCFCFLLEEIFITVGPWLMKLYTTPPSILTLMTWVLQSRMGTPHIGWQLGLLPWPNRILQFATSLTAGSYKKKNNKPFFVLQSLLYRQDIYMYLIQKYYHN